MSSRYWFGASRTICNVLQEMRALNETRNYSLLLSHIEEIQSMANRMETALTEGKELHDREECLKNLKKEIRKLEAERNKLKEEVKKDGNDSSD